MPVTKFFPKRLLFIKKVCIFFVLLSAIFSITPCYSIDKCSIIVEKSKRILTLNSNKTSLIYSIRLGQNPIGNKEFEGDNKTPEGNYKIISKNPKSAYHLGLKINYPNKDDIKRIKKTGKKPGGNIFIHGQKKNADHTYVTDWTSGCVALSNKDMDELYKKVSVGCKITIKK